MNKFIHATNLKGIDSLLDGDELEKDFLCVSSFEGSISFMNRDVLFLVEGEEIRRFNGDCGSDDNGNVMSCKDTTYDEVHIKNDFFVEGLWYDKSYNLENYALAYAFITNNLKLPCDIYNCDEETKEMITNYDSNMSDEEYDNWIEENFK